MRTIRLTLLSLTLLLLVISCRKDDDPLLNSNPEIETLAVSELRFGTVTLNANITSVGKPTVLEYGFLFGKEEPYYIKADTTIILPNPPQTDKFSSTLECALEPETFYNVKAYMLTTDTLVYGGNIGFISPKDSSIVTLGVTEIDSSGARLNGEILKLGKAPIIEYGFILGETEPFYDNAEKIVSLPEEAQEGIISTKLEEYLIGGFTYNVKAFLRSADTILYGENVSFLSKGSQAVPWGFEVQQDVVGQDVTFGATNDEHGFVIWQNGAFYEFDPEQKTFTQKASIPTNGDNSLRYAVFNIGRDLYVGTNAPQRDSILKYEYDNDRWVKLGLRPQGNNPPGGVGVNLNGVGYLVSVSELYSYNQDSDSWTERATPPFSRIYTTIAAEGLLFIVGDNRNIYKYTPETDSWTIETTFPGTFKQRIVGFNVREKIYVGMSYNFSRASGLAARDLWEYNPLTKLWKEVNPYPIPTNHTELFKFTIGNKGYVGFNVDQNQFDIWSFNADKLE